jgi:hypothetical protein
MRFLLAQVLLIFAAPAFAQDCVPHFFNVEPRDSEWFYGAGKGPDASAAREDALRHLTIKASGGKAALSEGTLAGWEQDDHGECGALHYALVRIEKDRVRKNIAEAPPPPPPPKSEGERLAVINNINNNVSNITLAPAERPYGILLGLLAFVLACLALIYRPRVVSYFYKAPGSAGARAPSTASSLREKFKAAPRQSQKAAMAEIASAGLPQYFRVHKGEGTCRPVPGSPELLHAGVLALLRPYAAGGWKIDSEDNALFAVSVKENLAMGFAFFLYASDEPGSTDCEIVYEISALIEDAYRNQMEEGLHQGLPWAVQAEAGRQGAARSKKGA